MQPMPCWEAFVTFLHSFIWFFYSLSGICQWELPSANTFFSTVCWSSRGLCSKARQEKGKTVQQREDGVSPSSSPAGLRRAGIQTRNLQIDDFPQPPPQATACLPEGLCDSGAPEKCLWPWKKKKVLTFHTAENLNKCELQCWAGPAVTIHLMRLGGHGASCARDVLCTVWQQTDSRPAADGADCKQTS